MVPPPRPPPPDVAYGCPTHALITGPREEVGSDGLGCAVVHQRVRVYQGERLGAIGHSLVLDRLLLALPEAVAQHYQQGEDGDAQ